jgi:hypothetical protein
MKDETLALMEDMSDSELERIAEIIYQKLAKKLELDDEEDEECDCKKEVDPVLAKAYRLPAIAGGFTHHHHNDDKEDDKEDETSDELEDQGEVDYNLPEIPNNDGISEESISNINISRSLISITEEATAILSKDKLSTLIVEDYSYDDIAKEISFTLNGKTIRCHSDSENTVQLSMLHLNESKEINFTLEKGPKFVLTLNKNDFLRD